jgi:hypothetical protein
VDSQWCDKCYKNLSHPVIVDGVSIPLRSIKKLRNDMW